MLQCLEHLLIGNNYTNLDSGENSDSPEPRVVWHRRSLVINLNHGARALNAAKTAHDTQPLDRQMKEHV